MKQIDSPNGHAPAANDIGPMPAMVGVEIAPCDAGIALRLSDGEGNMLTGAFSPHQARDVAARLLAMADAGSEPRTVSVLVITNAEAWINGQEMRTRRNGNQLQHSFLLPWGKQAVAQARPKLIIPGR